MTVVVERETVARLDAAGRARGCSAEQVLARLAETVARDGLVDAVLDDGAATEPSPPDEPVESPPLDGATSWVGLREGILAIAADGRMRTPRVFYREFAARYGASSRNSFKTRICQMRRAGLLARDVCGQYGLPNAARYTTAECVR